MPPTQPVYEPLTKELQVTKVWTFASHKNLLSFFLTGALFLLDVLMLLLSWHGGLAWGGEPLGPSPREPLLVFVVSAVAIFSGVGLYEKQRSLMNIKETQQILLGVFFSFLAMLVWPALSATTVVFPLLAVRIALLMAFLLSLERYAFFKFEQVLFKKGIGMDGVLISAPNELGRRLATNMRRSPKLGKKPVGFLVTEERSIGHQVNGVPILGRMEELPEILKDARIDAFCLSDPCLPQSKVLQILEMCRTASVKFWMIPELPSMAIHSLELSPIGNVPLVCLKDRRFLCLTKAVKRLFDLLFSALGLVFLSPLFLVLSVMIKLDSPGPILFVQERVGLKGRRFKVYKFRTMYREVAGDAWSPKVQGDARVTRVGRWMRRWSLDELPQFFNALTGEMSLVGPRPEMPFIVAGYDEMTRERLMVKPGITGLWQISTDRSRQIHDNIEYDLYYVANQSFLLDQAILLKTVVSVVRGVGAY